MVDGRRQPDPPPPLARAPPAQPCRRPQLRRRRGSGATAAAPAHFLPRRPLLMETGSSASTLRTSGLMPPPITPSLLTPVPTLPGMPPSPWLSAAPNPAGATSLSMLGVVYLKTYDFMKKSSHNHSEL